MPALTCAALVLTAGFSRNAVMRPSADVATTPLLVGSGR